mmetsp:Transcript_72129/g.203784  ORF Transcript_72129/g.203784 Transcript_72129/m.203784 type:complete len:804 (-) Transcript_72129:1074-3485(-)
MESGSYAAVSLAASLSLREEAPHVGMSADLEFPELPLLPGPGEGLELLDHLRHLDAQLLPPLLLALADHVVPVEEDLPVGAPCRDLVPGEADADIDRPRVVQAPALHDVPLLPVAHLVVDVDEDQGGVRGGQAAHVHGAEGLHGIPHADARDAPLVRPERELVGGHLLPALLPEAVALTHLQGLQHLGGRGTRAPRHLQACLFHPASLRVALLQLARHDGHLPPLRGSHVVRAWARSYGHLAAPGLLCNRPNSSPRSSMCGLGTGRAGTRGISCGIWHAACVGNLVVFLMGQRAPQDLVDLVLQPGARLVVFRLAGHPQVTAQRRQSVKSHVPGLALLRLGPRLLRLLPGLLHGRRLRLLQGPVDLALAGAGDAAHLPAARQLHAEAVRELVGVAEALGLLNQRALGQLVLAGHHRVNLRRREVAGAVRPPELDEPRDRLPGVAAGAVDLPGHAQEARGGHRGGALAVVLHEALQALEELRCRLLALVGRLLLRRLLHLDLELGEDVRPERPLLVRGVLQHRDAQRLGLAAVGVHGLLDVALAVKLLLELPRPVLGGVEEQALEGHVHLKVLHAQLLRVLPCLLRQVRHVLGPQRLRDLADVHEAVEPAALPELDEVEDRRVEEAVADGVLGVVAHEALEVGGRHVQRLLLVQLHELPDAGHVRVALHVQRRQDGRVAGQLLLGGVRDVLVGGPLRALQRLVRLLVLLVRHDLLPVLLLLCAKLPAAGAGHDLPEHEAEGVLPALGGDVPREHRVDAPRDRLPIGGSGGGGGLLRLLGLLQRHFLSAGVPQLRLLSFGALLLG